MHSNHLQTGGGLAYRVTCRQKCVFYAREGGGKKESQPEWLSLYFLFSGMEPPIPPCHVKHTLRFLLDLTCCLISQHTKGVYKRVFVKRRIS